MFRKKTSKWIDEGVVLGDAYCEVQWMTIHMRYMARVRHMSGDGWGREEQLKAMRRAMASTESNVTKPKPRGRPVQKSDLISACVTLPNLLK